MAVLNRFNTKAFLLLRHTKNSRAATNLRSEYDQYEGQQENEAVAAATRGIENIPNTKQPNGGKNGSNFPGNCHEFLGKGNHQ